MTGGPAAGRLASRGAPRRAGFTLIEVLIALAVFTVGAAGLLSLYAAAASTHRRAVDRTNAALVAEKVLAMASVLYRVGERPEDIVAGVRREYPERIEGYLYELTLFRPEGDEWEADELFAQVEVAKAPEIGALQADQVRNRAERFHTLLIPHHRLGEAPEDEE
jgi:type II secretion system protein I